MASVDELCFAPARRLLSLLRAREVSAEELVSAFFERIESHNHKFNAIVTLVEERALEEAAEADRRLATRGEGRPLEGLPITIKDHVATAGVRSTDGMKILEHHVPDRDAPTVERLRAAGAIIIAKTNLPEMAMDYDCDNPVFGATRNPWNLDRVPGGSSGGEAAALAAGLSPLGLGTDIGGSIRVPSHFCGTVGLKPGWGTIPPNGLVNPLPPFAPTSPPDVEMGVIGPMARSVDDLTLAYNILRGPHPSSPHTASSTEARPETVDLKRLRCVFFTGGGPMPVAPEIRDAIASAARALQKTGVAIDEKTPPIARAAEIWLQYLTADGNRTVINALGENVKLSRERLKLSMLSPAPDLPTSEFFKVAIARDTFRADLAGFMERYPIVICPVFCTTAFPHGALAVEVEGQTYPVYTAGWPSTWVNLAGLPAAVVSADRDRQGLPIGVQIVGRAFAEETVLAVARALEAELGGYQRPPL
jgi:amidase